MLNAVLELDGTNNPIDFSLVKTTELNGISLLKNFCQKSFIFKITTKN